MFLVTVESGNVGHLLVGKYKVEDINVLSNVSRIARAWNSHDMTLLVPAQNHLYQ